MITREDLVEQSVTDLIRGSIFDVRGYSPNEVVLLDSFPYTGVPDTSKNYIAAGFNFDDGGEQAEIGSDLMKRVYTLEFFVFGISNTYARNLANVIKFAFQNDTTIALFDYSQQPKVEIDRLDVGPARSHREIIPNPEPWQEFVWSTSCEATDYYHASLV